jgi:hypothetical protein
MPKWLWRLTPHDHIWKTPHNGCCGPAHGKRVCTKCGLEQWMMVREVTLETKWVDSPRERIKKIILNK